MKKAITKSKSKKRGPPSRGGKTPLVALRLAPEIQQALDKLASSMPDQPSRSQLIRDVIVDHLKARGLL
jgi:hypothetical protein